MITDKNLRYLRDLRLRSADVSLLTAFCLYPFRHLEVFRSGQLVVLVYVPPDVAAPAPVVHVVLQQQVPDALVDLQLQVFAAAVAADVQRASAALAATAADVEPASVASSATAADVQLASAASAAASDVQLASAALAAAADVQRASAALAAAADVQRASAGARFASVVVPV
jgi:hypothetical protein